MRPPFQTLLAPAREWIRRNPCAGVCFSILAVLSARNLAPDAPLLSSSLAAAAIPLLYALLFGFGKALRLGAYPAFLALLSLTLHDAEARNVPLHKALGRDLVYAQMRLTVDDPGAPGVTAWPRRPDELQCRVTAIRFGPNEVWRTTEGPILLSLRSLNENGNPVPLGYGDSLEVEGTAEELLSAPYHARGFDYADYLSQRGFQYRFHADAMSKNDSGRGLLRTLYDQRTRVLNRITSGIQDPDLRDLCAGILFGLRQGIPHEVKQAHLRSGTIHLLTVSGTHVMILAGLLMLLFRFLGIRARVAPVLILTTLYALSTGLHAPAFRALFMISAFLLFRAFLYRSFSLNVLFFVAAVLLLIRPNNLTDAGFQFSFLTVGVLIAGGPGLDKLLKTLDVRTPWVPSRYQTVWRTHLRIALRRGLEFLCGCILAWLATVSLSMVYQGILPAAAVIANLLVFPLIFLVFGSALVLLLFAWVPGVPCGVGTILEYALSGLNRCSYATGTYALNPGRVSAVFAFLFLGMLLLLIHRPISRKTPFLLTAMVLLLFFFTLLPRFGPPEIAIFYGGGSDCPPSLVGNDPATGTAWILHVPNTQAAYAIRRYLESRGVGVCTVLIQHSAAKPARRAVDTLRRGLEVQALVLPEHARSRIAGCGESVFFFQKTDLKQRTFSGFGLTCTQKDDTFCLRSELRGASISLEIEPLSDGTVRVRMSHDEQSGTVQEFLLENRLTGNMIINRMPIR